MLRIRISEGDRPEVDLLWDSQWHPPEGVADWVISDGTEPQNQGGLRAKATLHTAVVLLLFTNKRVPDNHPLRYLVDSSDPQGWWGDTIDVRADLNETELGSLLWIFQRSILTEDIRRWTQSIALDALAPLIAQKAAVRVDAQAVAEFAENRMDLAVQIYGRDGSVIYDQRFQDIWTQSVTSPAPLPFVDPNLVVATYDPSLDFSDARNSMYL